MRQAYDYWQDQPGSCLWPEPDLIKNPAGRTTVHGPLLGREPVRLGQHCHASGRPSLVERTTQEGGRLSLGSPLSIPPPSSNDSEATRPRGRRNTGPGGASRRSGRSASQPRRARPLIKKASPPQPFWQPAIRYACTSCINTSSPSPTAPWPVTAKRGGALATDRFQSAASID